MLYIILALFLIIMFLTLLYIVVKFKNITYLKDLSLKSKKKYYILIIIFILFLASFIIIDFINSFVVFFHFLIFSLFFDLVFIKKVKKNNIPLLLAILTTFAYLGYGMYSAYNVRKTTYNLSTKKEVEALKIAQIADSHIGATFDSEGFKKYIEEIALENPDLIVITGDFVDDDTSKKDMIKSCEAFKNLNLKYGIYFIFGNHDKGLLNTRDFTEEDLRKELKKNNVIILEDEKVELGENFILVGRQDKTVKNRKNASELIDYLDKNKYIIVLDHQPNDYESLSKSKPDLVLSGHTHGGQLIPLGKIGLLTGANDQTYGLEKRNNTNFIVSSGISNWALKFKTGTFSEYVIINIKKSK